MKIKPYLKPSPRKIDLRKFHIIPLNEHLKYLNEGNSLSYFDFLGLSRVCSRVVVVNFLEYVGTTTRVSMELSN